ncbi:histidinol-phosphate transaminase [Leuconostocaceae bacterium ESL0723]|nr:histidinol-phosphate transaminase [Leuconostocaceae bacterium ESL0723]
MKDSVRKLEAYQAETPIEAVKDRYNLDHLARLSANESVAGPSPKVKAALKTALEDLDLNYYPDGQATVLREAIADLNQVPADNLVLGVGADELIQLLTRVVLTPGSNMVVPDPTFGEYGIHGDIEQVTTKKVPVNPEDGHIDFKALRDAVDDQTEMVWLANPNNPTGVFEPVAKIQAFLEDLPADVVLVVDEAYFDFVKDANKTVAPLVAQYPNLVVLRTLSKAYGLANVRVGYGIMQDPLYTAMQAVRLPYNLSNLQMAAGTAAVQDQDYLKQVVSDVWTERDKFQNFLADNQIPFYDSQANFVWLDVGDAPKVGQQLLERGYQIKSSSSPSWVRIALGTPAENAGLQEALKEILGK